MVLPFRGPSTAFFGSVALFIFLGVTLGADGANVSTNNFEFGDDDEAFLHGWWCGYFSSYNDMRSTWSSTEEVCGQKLPFELWIYMKAEGTAEDVVAQNILQCFEPRLISKSLVELTTPEDWDTTIMNAVAPGALLGETKRSASYLVRSPLDFEAMCADDQVTKVSRVDSFIETRAFPQRKLERRLQKTVNETGTVYGVDELVTGLKELGCQKTTGENQTLCIMSDSFNLYGAMSTLQESGRLPPDDFLTIVEELPIDFAAETGKIPLDEGSAMVELAYEIAKGAKFKFNTMMMGNLAAADDIIKLSTGEDEGGEACDVIVDDISYPTEPVFRDGVISQAVEMAVDAGTLYFASAGDFGNGYMFTSNWECESYLSPESSEEPCGGNGIASHVFDTEATGLARYLLLLDGAMLNSSTFYVHWDDDEGTSRFVTLQLIVLNETSSGELVPLDSILAVSDLGTAVVSLPLPERFSDDDIIYALTISQNYADLDDVEMRLISTDYGFLRDFSDGSVTGHKCASSIISVAAFDVQDASGTGEVDSVPAYSSRGPCYVDSGSGLETRLKPVITAATGLRTSEGKSASALVAAAIATIVRAACYPRVATYDDMMEMLTNYDNKVDDTSDAGSEGKTWGPEAGYGSISVNHILAWVARNCQGSCPGAAKFSSSPTPAPAAESTRQLVDASEKTTVTVNANAYDTRTSEFGCAPYGCKADNTRDGNLSTRWSCQEGMLKDENCEVTYTFEQPQDIVQMLIAFYKGDERAHKLKVKVNGSSQYIMESSGETNGFEAFELDFYGTESLALEGLGLHRDEWIGITEVEFMVE